jgi:hypothetical protein
MGRKQTGDELNARAKANGYKRGAHREEDSRRVTDTEINKEDRSEVYDVSIFHHLMARLDLILTSGSVDGYRCSVVIDPDVAGDWRLAFFVRPSLYRSLPPGPQAGPGFLPCGAMQT